MPVDTYPPQNLVPATTQLGYAEALIEQTGVTTEVDLTSLVVTVFVSAGRRIKITGTTLVSSTVAGDRVRVQIKEGTTILNLKDATVPAANGTEEVTVTHVFSPAAGTHTYKLTFQRLGGTGTVSNWAGATYPSFILVEDITGGTGGSGPISLGYAESTVDQTAIGTTETTATGLSVTINVPAGRRIKVTAHLSFAAPSAAMSTLNRIYQDGVGYRRDYQIPSTASSNLMMFEKIFTPAAGTHTYGVTTATSTGTMTLQAGSYISVEDITGTPAPALALASSSTIAYTSVTANQTGITTEVDLTGLTITFTVPAGRSIRLTAFTLFSRTVGDGTVTVRIREGATQIVQTDEASYGTDAATACATVILSPSAGTHTYKMTMQRPTGTGTVSMLASSTYPAYLLAEDITGGAVPTTPTSVPVGVLGRSERAIGAPESIGSGQQDIPGLSVTVTVPAGRLLRISMFCCLAAGGAGQNETNLLEDGSNQLNRSYFNNVTAGQIVTHAWSVYTSPSAGQHTYKARSNLGSAGTIYDDGLNETYIAVEDVTPTPAPANTAPSSTLAYAEITTSQTIGATSTETDLTGLTVTVTVPAGRRLRITGHSGFQAGVAGDRVVGYIKEGATYLGRYGQFDAQQNGGYEIMDGAVIVSPSAGTHTYKLTTQRYGGTGSLATDNASDRAGFIVVEDITGSGISGHTHTELDDTGWISLVPLLVNSWVSYDNNYGPPRYRRKAGVVYVQGLVRSGTLGSVIATLPVGFRPSIPTLLVVGNEHNGATAGRLDMYSDGRIVHAGGSWNDYVALSGLIFPADQ